MKRVCPACGCPVRGRTDRNEMSVLEDPTEIYHKGRRLKLRPAQSKILALLLIQEEATYGELRAALGRAGRTNALAAHMSYMRAKLPPGVQILNIRGVGYRVNFPGA